MDQKLQLHNDIELAQVANIVFLCLQVEVEKRPTMFRVMGMLEGQMEIPMLLKHHKHHLEYDLNLATILEDFKKKDDQPLCEGMFNNDRSSSSTNLWGSNYIELDDIRKQCMN